MSLLFMWFAPLPVCDHSQKRHRSHADAHCGIGCSLSLHRSHADVQCGIAALGGKERNGTGSWVQGGQSGARHPLSPVIRLGPRK